MKKKVSIKKVKSINKLVKLEKQAVRKLKKLDPGKPCDPQLIGIIEDLYLLTQKIAFHFVPAELYEELISVGDTVERAVTKARAHKATK